MASYAELTASRIAFHEDQLQRIQTRIQSLRQNLAATLRVPDSALSCAHEVLDTLRGDIRDLDAQVLNITDTIRYLHQRLNPRVMHTLPPELLISIFHELCGQKQSDEFPGFRLIGAYDKSRARMPFVVAAVCGRWRRIALDTASLWTYVGLGQQSSDAQWSCAKEYFDICLSRSRDAPLSICLELADAQWETRGAVFCTILDSVAAVSSRWRSLLLGLPYAEITPELLQMFQYETPLLEELVACLEDHTVPNPWHTDFPHYLPHAPALRAMRTDGCHVILTSPHHTLSNLVHLELQVNLPLIVIWDMLKLAPALEHLELDITYELLGEWKDDWRVTAPSDQLRLGSLRSLSVCAWAYELFAVWGDRLVMPQLNKVAAFEQFTHEIQPLAELTAESVTILQWHASASTEMQGIDATCLSAFCNVQELVLQEKVTADFFTTALTDFCWPKLETLAFRQAELDEEAANALLLLVRLRKLPAPEGEDNPTVPLKSVTFEASKIPASLDDRVRALL